MIRPGPTLEARAWRLFQTVTDPLSVAEIEHALGIDTDSREDLIERLRKRGYIARGSAWGTWIPVDRSLELPAPDYGGHRARKARERAMQREVDRGMPCALLRRVA